MNELLIDTNILVYSIDIDSNYHKKSLSLVTDSSKLLYTTSKNISKFLVVLIRTSSTKIEINEELDILLELISNMTVLYPTEKSNKVFINLLKKHKPLGLQIHDFEIISIGLANGIKRIATRNISDFKEVEEIQIEMIE